MVVSPIFAGTFPSRPTLALMDETVAEGTVCGQAVRERTLAVNGTWTNLPYCGFRQPYFASLQQKLESLAPQYIDHVNGPLNASGTAFRYFTLATWRAAAGLNASGFRRYDFDDNLIGYGIAQSNDAICAATFQDLRAGFGALMWTVKSASLVQGKYKNIPGWSGIDTNDCSVTLSTNRTLWLNPWITNQFFWGSAVYYCGYLFGHDPIVPEQGSRSGRQRGKCSVTVPTMRPCSASVYAQCRRDFNNSYFIMLDGLPGTETQMVVIATFPETSEAVRQTAEIGGYEGNPLDIVGAACPYSDVSAGGGYFDCKYLLKWNFTSY